MTDNPQTEYQTEEPQREVTTWCGECRGWQAHTLTKLGEGRAVLKCQHCHAETHSGEDSQDQPRLF